MLNEGEVLPKLLAAIGLWPPAGWESPWERGEVEQNLREASRALGERELVVLVWLAVMLGPVGKG